LESIPTDTEDATWTRQDFTPQDDSAIPHVPQHKQTFVQY